MLGHHSSAATATVFYYTVTGKVAAMNLHAVLIAAGWSGDGEAIVTIDGDAEIYSASPTTGAMLISGFSTPPILVVNGSILGANGDRGDGGALYHNGGNGHDGGDAIRLGCDVIIDNTYGSIFGGGGGGGGGAGSSRPPTTGSGSGGDGGRGAGTVTGGTVVTKESGFPADGGNARAGGNGGGWGENGLDGGSNATYTGGTRGHGGYAVKLNGYAVEWRGGFNSTQVKGSVA